MIFLKFVLLFQRIAFVVILENFCTCLSDCQYICRLSPPRFLHDNYFVLDSFFCFFQVKDRIFFLHFHFLMQVHPASDTSEYYFELPHSSKEHNCHSYTPDDQMHKVRKMYTLYTNKSGLNSGLWTPKITLDTWGPHISKDKAQKVI